MMFFSPGFGMAQGSLSVRYWTHADRKTVLYVPYGYSRSEKLALEFLRGIGVHVQAIRSVGDLLPSLNGRTIDGERHDILRLMFICHGLPGRLALNYSSSPGINLTKRSMTRISPDSFCAHARVYSYACRTGVWRGAEEFDQLSDAEPENSLAQAIATHLGIPFHAFYTRTLFRGCIRDPEDSEAIALACKRERVGNEGSILTLSDEHEALPHPGQGLTRYVVFESGQVDEGTSEYSLWRKAGVLAEFSP